MHVLAWGAINAAPTKPGAKQVAFQLDYSGGYQKYFLDDPAAQALAKQYHKIKGTPGYLDEPGREEASRASQLAADNYWQTAFHGGCGHYDGPKLAWAVAACKAPRRQLLGRPGVAAQAPGLRPRRRTASTPPGRCTSRTGRARCPC